MSAFDPENNVSPQNLTVPIESRTIPINIDAIPNTQTKFNSQYQFGKIIGKFVIDNDDPVNDITYRIPSPSSPLRRVPPSSVVTVEEYTYYMELNYAITNITSTIELDLIKKGDAQERTSLVGNGAA